LNNLTKLEYDKQFLRKELIFKDKLKKFTDNLECIKSPKYINYRFRSEFSIATKNNKLTYSMYKDSVRIFISEHLISSKKINLIMKDLISIINNSFHLNTKLFQVEFQDSRSGDFFITLIYHKELDIKWEKEANILSTNFGVSIIGRSKNQKIVIGNDFVIEDYKTKNNQFSIKLFEQCFSQINPYICDHILNWIENATSHKKDIVELHCGVGTFTILLSKLYSNVLATENSRPSINGLIKNLKLNKITNVHCARLSGLETLEAINLSKQFRRLSNLKINDFLFETIFIDPPRQGLDSKTIKYLVNFKKIIYVSCGFKSLVEDLDYLRSTHKVIKAAFFDQFPFTNHLESVVILEKL
tara:strand:+ start:3020 stop:4090 length:1071 start_codon:yes stop_codon:yes gene_type:complete